MRLNGPTILVDKYRKAPTVGEASGGYGGLRIHALPGLHAFVGQQAERFFPAGAAVVDLAAGSGAMALRLRDLGYSVSAADYVQENFRATGIPFVRADLNQDFSRMLDGPFAGIVASEIIEHLENPRHFAREAFALLRPGGRMIVTTPNCDSAAAKASFVRSGQFLWFRDKDYAVEGHINPMSQWQVDRCFVEAGFSFLWKGSFNAKHSQLSESPRLTLLTRLIAALSLTPLERNGEIFIAVVERPFLTATS